LVGLDEGGVRKLLGAPAETRTDGAARILAYRAASCGLDVIFFMDVKAGDLRVVSYQWDDNGGTRPQVAKGCYAEFRVPQ
jgi:metal-dependent amidase/aminoacylase/carboxypeptidase family protein